MQEEEVFVVDFNFDTNLPEKVCNLRKLLAYEIEIGYVDELNFRKFKELTSNLKIIDNAIVG